jgi:leucyl/phenylalanyl-tRNA--protein transferase
MPIPWIEPDQAGFPPVEQALTEPDGLLVAGGDLGVGRLLDAYRHGIFPWYEEDQPILWWSPDPRLVLIPSQLKLSRSLGKLIRRGRYTVSFDRDFPAVIRRCAEHRAGSTGTWITTAMEAAYVELHDRGFAHSVEVWSADKLVGGLYGIALGRVFFGESMFSEEDNTSKLALVYLVKQLQRWDYELIDCQVSSDHLKNLGAVEIRREEFVQQLRELIPQKVYGRDWKSCQTAATGSNEF